MKKLNSFLLAAAGLLSATQGMAQFGTGLVFNPNMKATAWSKSSLGYANETPPSSYSLKPYAPFAKSQGIYPSCSGWAVSYEAFSIQFAIANGMTNSNLITAKAFCPYYSYNKEQPADPTCKAGKDAAAMMNTLMNDGGKKFYLPLLGCGSSLSNEFDYASRYYKIKDFFQLKVWPDNVSFDANDIPGSWKKFFSAEHPMSINDIKICISHQYPVVIGAALPTSFYNAGELWEPTSAEKADPSAAIMENTGAHRLHAMTVVGYDDSKYGGAFEVMNSWSEGWGNKGFFWVKYDDFKTFVFSALVMELFPPEQNTAGMTGVIWGDCKNGYGFYKHANGQAYEGQSVNGLYDGYGIYTWPNGSAYAGQWKNGKRHGEATNYFPSGTFGQAQYDNDTFVSGYNEYTFVNGDSYKGYVKNGKFHGYGEYKFAAGDRYIGTFDNGNLSGLVKYEATDGSTFLGYYTDGKRNGKGIIVGGGQISAGDWMYGVYQNEKTYGFTNSTLLNTKTQMSSNMYLSADCESGNCLMGEGKRVTGNGCTYEGTFVDGLEDGKGIMKYTDAIYDGSWKQGKKHGIGELKFDNGVIVIAEFVNDMVTGYILKYDNAGNMAVEQYLNGVKIADYNQLSSTPSTGSGPKIPTGVKSVPVTVTAIK